MEPHLTARSPRVSRSAGGGYPAGGRAGSPWWASSPRPPGHSSRRGFNHRHGRTIPWYAHHQEAWNTLCCALECLSLCVGLEKKKKAAILKTKTSPSPGPGKGLSLHSSRTCRENKGAARARSSCPGTRAHSTGTKPTREHTDTDTPVMAIGTSRYTKHRMRTHTHSQAHTGRTRMPPCAFRNQVGGRLCSPRVTPRGSHRQGPGLSAPAGPGGPFSGGEIPPQMAFSGPSNIPGSAERLIPQRLPGAPFHEPR